MKNEDELFIGIETIIVDIPIGWSMDMSEEEKEKNDDYFESMMRLGF